MEMNTKMPCFYRGMKLKLDFVSEEDEEEKFFFSVGLIASIWVFDSRNFVTTEFIYHGDLFGFSLSQIVREISTGR